MPSEHAGPSQGYRLVVVPTYNEAQNITRLLAAIIDQGPQFDILVVDDNSPDGTGDLVAAIAQQIRRACSCCGAPAKLGLGTAYREGSRIGAAAQLWPATARWTPISRTSRTTCRSC